MNHWAILIFGIVVAIVVWIFLSRRLVADNTSAQDSKDNEKWEECTDEDVLREAVRLAELRIEELSQTIRILEHKAIALVTLCFAVMGYFYTIEEWSCNFFELLRGVALFSLFIPSLFGIRVVFLGRIGIAGINPQASLWRAKYHQSNDNMDIYDRENKDPKISKLLIYTLAEYHTSIEATKKRKMEKPKNLNTQPNL